MEITGEQLQELLARRLLTSAKEAVKQSTPTSTAAPPSEGESLNPRELSISDFAKIEKNLASFGLFTPSSKKIKNAKSKTITFSRMVDGNKVEARVTIAPSAIYGLPITSDQDKYIALQKLIGDLRQGTDEITNPIGFTSAQLLRALGKRVRTGKNYDDIDEWLKRMTLTGIISEGVVYLAGKKTWASDTFHVFERAISFGQETPDGGIADKNYVWLSDWQLGNINSNYLLPIEFETYKQLKNHIAKALVPLLQIWLFATTKQGSFEKRYEELTQHLNIRQYSYPSKIMEKLGPALDELKAHGYLADWKLEKTSDRKAYKVVFYHGAKFHRDRQRRLHQKEQSSTFRRRPSARAAQLEQGIAPNLLAELIQRGITHSQAHKLLGNLADGQEVTDQLEWGDHVIAQTEPGKIYNPAGFFVHLIKENIPPAPSFESSRKKRLRQEAELASHLHHENQAQLKLAYEMYRANEIDQYIASHPDDYAAYVAEKRQQLTDKGLSSWSEPTLTKLAELAARSHIASRLSFDSFDYFSQQYRTEGTPISASPTQAIPLESEQGSEDPVDAGENYIVA
jgi:hypothetical protein